MLQSSSAPLDHSALVKITPPDHVGPALAPPILLQYWQIVVRWKWIIAGIVVTCLLVGLVATLLTTPKFTARSRLEISREQKNIT